MGRLELSIDDCRCACHDPHVGYAVKHAAACCSGQTLAWGAWGIDDVPETVGGSKHHKVD